MTEEVINAKGEGVEQRADQKPHPYNISSHATTLRCRMEQ